MEENKEVEVLGEEKVIEQSQPEVKESFVENKEEPVEPNKKGNNKNIVTIILIIVASLCIVGVVVFFVSNKDKGNEQEVVEKEDEDKKEITDDATKKEDNNSSTTEKKDDSTLNDGKKIVSSDSDLENTYQKIDSLSQLEIYAEKVANFYVYSTQFNFNTGSVSNMNSTDIINMTILLLPMNNDYVNTCYKQDYINKKVNDLFNLKYDNTISWKSGTIENNCYCTDYSFGAGGNPNPLSMLSKNKYESNESIFVDVEYGYENNKIIITVEFKSIDGRYIISSVSKK